MRSTTQVLLFALLTMSNILFAGQTGKIAGRVQDADRGEPLPGTNIYLQGTSFGAACDEDGDYIILNLPPGSYTVVASIIGFQETQINNVSVSIDKTTRLDFNLKSEIIQGEAIIVEAEQPMIQNDLTATASSVSAKEIQAIPVENLQDVLQLQAGIIVDNNGDFHIRGGRSSEIAYMIDGVSVSDPYDGRMAVNVNQDAIQELKVISGTFNAEYGKAMSGVVELVTKDPGEKFSADVSAYFGDYISSHSGLFYNIDDVTPTSLYNLQVNLTGPVPFFDNKLGYYASVRRQYNDGWMYGQQRYLPSDSSVFESNSYYSEQNGSGHPVAMNASSEYYGNFKLSYEFSPQIRLNYNFLGHLSNYGYYDHLYKYNPSGNVSNHEYGYTNMLILNHTLSSTSFYTLKLSRYKYNSKTYLYKDLNDPRYQNPELLRSREDAYSFLTGGTNLTHTYRTTIVTQGKVDFTSQVTKIHQLKAGIEFKANELSVENDEAKYHGKASEIFNATLFFSRGKNTNHPVEFAAYIQDKIELKSMTLNAGLRYDYFDSGGKEPTDLRNPGNDIQDHIQSESAAFNNANIQQQLSPRVGLAFPISASGVIHASYGHFFQIPPYEYLYVNPHFAIAPGGLYTLLGNANLKPQSTVIYEVGIQQELADNLSVDITGYYKDARNLLGTSIYETYILGDRYARYENRDYGNIRGITFTVNKRPTFSDHLTASFDYTFQVAEGNASDPNQTFNNGQADPPKQSNIQIVPLNWDQRHTINLSVSYDNPDIGSIGLVGQIQSGLPYTPAIQSLETTFENSGRKPTIYNVDMRLSRDFVIDDISLNVFIKIYNLFDRKNEVNVYSDTGRSGYSLISQFLGTRQGHVNSLEEWLKRPDYYSEPRRILVGFGVRL